MPCCQWNITTTWVKSLRVGLDYRNYTVQVHRDIRCCSETARVYVNDQEMVDHKLERKACSFTPHVQFEQDGHTFLLMYDSYSYQWSKDEQVRLFIDGIDMNSGLEYSAYWRRRGWQQIGSGAVFLLLAAVVLVILALVLGWQWVYLAYTAGLYSQGVPRLIAGVVLLKHRKLGGYHPAGTHLIV